MSYLNNGGGITNISTGQTRFTLSGHYAYVTMKRALEVLSKYQTKELGDRKIRVNIITSRAIETEFGSGVNL